MVRNPCPEHAAFTGLELARMAPSAAKDKLKIRLILRPIYFFYSRVPQMTPGLAHSYARLPHQLCATGSVTDMGSLGKIEGELLFLR